MVRIKFNHAEFDRTLRQYRELSRRSQPVILNTKAFYIARNAVWHTEKANKSAIKDFIEMNKGAIAGKIINKRHGPGKGLYGPAMRQAIKRMLGARNRSIAFLRSGWIPAIKAFEPLAERPKGASLKPKDRTAKQVGKPKGWARIARPSAWLVKAVLANTAQARWDEARGKAAAILQKGLQAAFDNEAASMLKYIERKCRDNARKLGIKTN